MIYKTHYDINACCLAHILSAQLFSSSMAGILMLFKFFRCRLKLFKAEYCSDKKVKNEDYIQKNPTCSQIGWNVTWDISLTFSSVQVW